MNLYEVTICSATHGISASGIIVTSQPEVAERVVAGSQVQITEAGVLIFRRDPNSTILVAYAPGHWESVRRIDQTDDRNIVQRWVERGALS